MKQKEAETKLRILKNLNTVYEQLSRDIKKLSKRKKETLNEIQSRLRSHPDEK